MPMKTSTLVACLAVGFAAVSTRATPAAQDGAPAFEAASVKPRASGGPAVQMVMNVTPGRIHFQAVWLKDCIRWAYGVADYQIRGGPDWLERTPRWDIEATAGSQATTEQMRAMFRTLLGERFGLRVHQEREDTRVLLLTVTGPGPRLKPAADDAPKSDDWRRSPLFQGSKPGPGSSRIRELTSQRTTMRQLVEYLSRQLRVSVLDRTGLSGDYAIAVEWPADPATPPLDPASEPDPRRVPPGQQPDLFGAAGAGAIREQLGLSLVAGRAPIDVLVIDSVHEATAN